MAGTQPITQLLREFASGDKSALNRLIPLVYSELRRLADAQLKREHRVHTLQATALVHEAYARLLGQDQPDYRSRAQFLGIAAQVMRQVLVDHARARNAAKRGNGVAHYSLNDALKAPADPSAQPLMLIAIDEALRTLERRDPLKTKLLEMRFFGGLTAQEMADVLELPPERVRTQLRVAQAWLRRELGPAPKPKK